MPPSPARPAPPAWLYLPATLAYVVAFYVSFLSVRLGDSVAPIWLGTGLAVWLVLRFGWRMLAVVVLGELIPKLLHQAPSSGALDLFVRCVMSTGNLLATILGVWVWRQVQARWLDRLGEFCEPVACLLTALLAPLAAATVGVSSLVISGQKPPAEAPFLWFGWWAADTIGILFLLPLLLSGPQLWQDLRLACWAQLLRRGALLLLTAALSWIAFWRPEGGRYLFALFPLLMLATYWCGQPGVRLMANLVVAAGTFSAACGHGPLVTGNLRPDLVAVQLFLSGIALLALLIPPLHARFNLFRPVSLALLFGGWALSGLLFTLVEADLAADEQADFIARTDRTQRTIERRLSIYTDALRGASGFLLASPHVDRTGWITYVDALRLPERYPGTIGLGLIYPVTPARAAEFVAAVQADGAPDFTLHGVPGVDSLAGRPEHFVLTYLEPQGGFHNVLGMDLGTDPVRRQALETARDTGQPRITGRIPMFQYQDQVPGFVLFVPVYRPGAPMTTVEERRAALLAWVDAPFVTAHFLQGAVGDIGGQLAVHLFDDGVADRDHLIFASGPPTPALPAFARTTTFELAGRKMLLGWNRSPHAKGAHRSPLIWLSLSMAVGTVLLTAWMLSLQLFRERAEALVVRRTAELAESEARFRTLIEHSPEAVAVHRDGKFVYGNPAALRLIGATSSEVLFGQPVIDRVHPDFRAVVLQRIAEVNNRAHDAPIVELKLIRLDGAIIEVESQATAIFYNGVPAVHSILRDVTARNRAEAARREALDRLQKIASRVPGVVYEYRLRPDGSACFPFASDAIRDIYGVSPEAVREDATEVFKVIHPDDFARVAASIRESAATLTPWTSEYRARLPDGQVRWLLGNSIPQREADGGTLWHGFITDITARKAAEAELHESRQKLAAIFDNAAAYIFLKDRSGRYLFANKMTCELFGVTAEAIVGSRDDAYFPAETAQRLREVDARVLRGEKTAEEITVSGAGDNSRVYWEVKSPIYAEGETEPWGILGVSTDITASKRIEADQQRLEEQNRQLQKSESLGRMAAAIAHHFNNQLHAVMLNLDMAATELPPASASTLRLAEAMKCARKATEVSNHMLTYLGQAQGKRTPQDLADVCRSSLPLLQAVVPKYVILDAQLPFPGPLISANPNQLQQVLTNLITNAWEACGDQPGRIRLTVRTASVLEIPAARFPLDWQPKDTAYACLEVTDTGAGIAPEEVEKIFDPFYSSKFVGRGLGLPVVLGIVRSHRGVIAVQSAPGKGSTFALFFPLALVAKPATPPPGERLLRSGAGRTVLVAEDDPVVLKVTAQALRHFGFSVLAARDGVEALDLFRVHQAEVGCLVCDLSMPRLGGWETLAEVRRLAPTLPVILSSGHDESAAMDGPHAEMPQAFLHKPYDTNALIGAITKAMETAVKA